LPRKDLLGQEKEFTRQRDELSTLRRELPQPSLGMSSPPYEGSP
jgi:predicted dithiol-disulfide oxidoreductase (DUF899 family)